MTKLSSGSTANTAGALAFAAKGRAKVCTTARLTARRASPRKVDTRCAMPGCEEERAAQKEGAFCQFPEIFFCGRHLNIFLSRPRPAPRKGEADNFIFLFFSPPNRNPNPEPPPNKRYRPQPWQPWATASLLFFPRRISTPALFAWLTTTTRPSRPPAPRCKRVARRTVSPTVGSPPSQQRSRAKRSNNPRPLRRCQAHRRLEMLDTKPRNALNYTPWTRSPDL